MTRLTSGQCRSDILGDLGIADLVGRELERRLRRATADVEILRRTHDDDGLDDLAAYAARLPVDLD